MAFVVIGRYTELVPVRWRDVYNCRLAKFKNVAAMLRLFTRVYFSFLKLLSEILILGWLKNCIFGASYRV